MFFLANIQVFFDNNFTIEKIVEWLWGGFYYGSFFISSLFLILNIILETQQEEVFLITNKVEKIQKERKELNKIVVKKDKNKDYKNKIL